MGKKGKEKLKKNLALKTFVCFGEEIDWLTKCLLYRYSNLHLDLQHPCKKHDMEANADVPALGRWRQKTVWNLLPSCIRRSETQSQK